MGFEDGEEIARFVDADGERVILSIAHYHRHNAIAVVGICAEGPYGKLSTAPDEPLGDDEFALKAWSENERWAHLALASGPFEATGRSVRAGEELAPVYRITRTAA